MKNFLFILNCYCLVFQSNAYATTPAVVTPGNVAGYFFLSKQTQPSILLESTVGAPTVTAGQSCNVTIDSVGVSADGTKIFGCQSGVWQYAIGATGPTGATGPQGPQGPAGDPGVCVSPQNPPVTNIVVPVIP